MPYRVNWFCSFKDCITIAQFKSDEKNESRANEQLLKKSLNGWHILTDETVEKMITAYTLVVPHETTGLRKIDFLFLRLIKALDRFYWLNTNKVRRHTNNLIVIPLHQNNIFVRIEIMKTLFFFWAAFEEAIRHFISQFSRIASRARNCFSFRFSSNLQEMKKS